MGKEPQADHLIFFMKQTSFQIEGYKRIKCTNCGQFLTESHLDEKHDRPIVCNCCGTRNHIDAPEVEYFAGMKGVSFGANGGCWTATPE